MLVETEWGPWEHMDPDEVAAAMAGYPRPWWVAGGFAIEAFLGAPLRDHVDIDISALHRDQRLLQVQLGGWELSAADPPGTLRPWASGEHLAETIHDIWARRREGEPWRFQFMLDNADGEDWVYRRDSRIRRGLGSLTFESGGIPYLAPEIQLLYKATGRRPKDAIDFEATLPMLTAGQATWLREALEIAHPGNRWIERLS